MSETAAQARTAIETEIRTGRVDEVAQYFIEYLSVWGPADIAALAQLVLARPDEDDEEL